MEKFSLHDCLTTGETYDIKIYQDGQEQETLRYLGLSDARRWLDILGKYKKPGIKLVAKKFKDNKYIDSEVIK